MFKIFFFRHLQRGASVEFGGQCWSLVTFRLLVRAQVASGRSARVKNNWLIFYASSLAVAIPEEGSSRKRINNNTRIFKVKVEHAHTHGARDAGEVQEVSVEKNNRFCKTKVNLTRSKQVFSAAALYLERCGLSA